MNMFWPFRRKKHEETPAADTPGAMYDEAAENLIAQGVDPRKVRRAAEMIKRYAEAGVLPDGLVKPKEE